MSSTFFGLTIAASGLNVSHAQINTTANNISNVETNGYSRQVVNTVAASALRCYQAYGTTGTGVEATSVTQCRDLYYDEKYWNNETALGFYDKKLYYMNQIQGFYSETQSKAGFTTVYSKLFNSLSTLQTSPGDSTVRKQFISDAKKMTEYFNTTSKSLYDLQNSINDEIKTAVDEINAISEKISILNRQINTIEQGGAKANELRDQRALLVDELSQYVSVDVTELPIKNTNYPDMDTGATYYRVDINGQTLVDNYDFKTLSVKSRDYDGKYNLSDVDGLYDIVWTGDGDVFNPCNPSNAGILKAMLEVRDGNNTANVTGTVSSANGQSITISGYSLMSDVNALNLPPSGTIWADGKQYKYDSFTFDTDSEGKITALTFVLDDTNLLTASEQVDLINKKLEVGRAVDFMGIPYYQNEMNLFVRNFCEMFNNIERGTEDDPGLDANGDPMQYFFVAKTKNDGEKGFSTSKTAMEKNEQNEDVIVGRTGISSNDETYYLLTARNLTVAYDIDKDASKMAVTTESKFSSGQDAADLVVQLQLLQNKTTIFRGGTGEEFLQCIYADVTVDTQECEIFTKNFENIQKSITQQRKSVAGVDQDEEALNLMKFQNAYNLASKCISVFSEIYDRLILQTGV